jgi:two-component system, OmpR family, response regulator
VPTLPVSSPIRVLLVDDEPGLIEVGSMALRMAGLEVTATSDPERALAILTNAETGVSPPDVMVTDLVMPRMTGVQLIAGARAAGADLPVLVISSYGTGEDLLGLLRVGLDDVLDKPLNVDQLVERVKALAAKGFKQKAAAGAARRKPPVPASDAAEPGTSTRGR